MLTGILVSMLMRIEVGTGLALRLTVHSCIGSTRGIVVVTLSYASPAETTMVGFGALRPGE